MSSIRKPYTREEAMFYKLAAKKLDEKVRPYFGGRLNGWLAMRIGRAWKELLEENPEYDTRTYEEEFAIVLDDLITYWRLQYKYFR